jgi:hypothetical protein
MFNTIVGAVGAGAAPRYSSGSDQMMRLLAVPAPQHWFKVPEGGEWLQLDEGVGSVELDTPQVLTPLSYTDKEKLPE